MQPVMQKVEEIENGGAIVSAAKVPISVIVATRNEARNLPQCLDSLREVGEVYVVDSGSTDATPDTARSFGAHVVQFHYAGGWPKKRQWAMDTLPLAFDWILLLDADESLTPDLTEEIRQAVKNPAIHGYYISLRMYFLGRVLRHSDASFQKLSSRVVFIHLNHTNPLLWDDRLRRDLRGRGFTVATDGLVIPLERAR